jgi:hypothetical protein
VIFKPNFLNTFGKKNIAITHPTSLYPVVTITVAIAKHQSRGPAPPDHLPSLLIEVSSAGTGTGPRPVDGSHKDASENVPCRCPNQSSPSVSDSSIIMLLNGPFLTMMLMIS